MNRAQEPRLRGGSSVAVALHATAGWTSNRFSADCRLSLMRMGEDAPRYQFVSKSRCNTNARRRKSFVGSRSPGLARSRPCATRTGYETTRNAAPDGDLMISLDQITAEGFPPNCTSSVGVRSRRLSRPQGVSKPSGRRSECQNLVSTRSFAATQPAFCLSSEHLRLDYQEIKCVE